jgi:hypothetical protein
MAPPQSVSFLLDLPMELLQRITVQLDVDRDAILSTRLACKTLEAATFDCFAEKFFNSHQYCILYRVSLLRLYALLASSSRLMARMRKVTFTSCFFSNSNYKHVQLALNQSETDLKSAQLSAMKAYSDSQIEMLQTQFLPDTELIRAVLVALKAKCPGVALILDILKNAISSIPVHARVLEAVAALGTPLTGLTLDPATLDSAELGSMQSGLSACASSLAKFCFGGFNKNRADAENRPFANRRPSLLPSMLSSANALRELTLILGHPRDRWVGGLTSGPLLANSYPMLQSLTLGTLAVSGRTILGALADWGGQLEKVNFRAVHLTNVNGEGWSDVLRALATLPKLNEARFCILIERRINSAPIFVDLRNLKTRSNNLVSSQLSQDAWRCLLLQRRSDSGSTRAPRWRIEILLMLAAPARGRGSRACTLEHQSKLGRDEDGPDHVSRSLQGVWRNGVASTSWTLWPNVKDFRGS